ncbi:cysteine desulfurase [Candidatus Micrarchaeota archaeon]|nr:cysteine desulfurase [Candidatus Micrarchaeota archaeon]
MDVEKIRNDFPILKRKINGKKLIYLDNGATSQKPIQVIDAVSNFYKKNNANIHRGIHILSEESTLMYDDSRNKVSRFIHSKNPEEIIFTRNATESINLVMYSWGKENISRGDKIVISEMEHHSNLIPWVVLAKEKGATLEYLELDKEGLIKEGELEKIKGAKFVSVVHVSNVTGVINDVEKICRTASEEGAVSLVDASQSAPHMKVDIQSIGCDFLAFTGHKMLAPTGIGVLYGKKEILDSMNPFLFGGEMVVEAHKYDMRWNSVPYKFEAGTPNISGAVGLGSAVDYLEQIGMENIRAHEKKLVSYALEKLGAVNGISIIGPQDSSRRSGIITFEVKGVHPHDVASILSEEGICLRSGYHCAQPLHESMGLQPTTRASFYIYNTEEEIDFLIENLVKVKKIFGV